MKKIYKIRTINSIIYTLFLAGEIYQAFFYESHSFAGGRAKGGAIGVLIVLLVALIGIAVQFYKETKSLSGMIEMLKELLVKTVSFPWHEFLLKKWRKSKKMHSNKTKRKN